MTETKNMRWGWIFAILATFCFLSPATALARTAGHHGHHHAAAIHYRAHARHGHHRGHHKASAATIAIANCVRENFKAIPMNDMQARRLHVGNKLNVTLGNQSFTHDIRKGDTLWGSCQADLGQLPARLKVENTALHEQVTALQRLLGRSNANLASARNANADLTRQNSALASTVDSEHSWLIGLWIVGALFFVLAILFALAFVLRSRAADMQEHEDRLKINNLKNELAREKGELDHGHASFRHHDEPELEPAD
jgi:hypothetical protein